MDLLNLWPWRFILKNFMVDVAAINRWHLECEQLTYADWTHLVQVLILYKKKNESLCLWSYSCAATLRAALSPSTKELYYVILGCTHCSWSWLLRLASPWRSRSQSHWSQSPRPSRASSSWSWTQSWPSLSTTSTSPNWQIQLNLA